jgi:uncharacterized membrane protein YgcG
MQMLGHLIMTSEWRFGNVHPKAYFKTVFSCTVAFLLSCYIIPTSLNVSTNTEVVAQLSPSTPSSPTTSGLPTIQIASVQEGQQVPPGELTIQGVSSDTEDTDCEVFADVNDVTPMQNVTAAGGGGDDEDFSTWTFTYTEDYQLISPGQNELTAKISCLPDEELDFNSLPSGPGAASTTSAGPLNEWHTVNVTGVAGAPPATLSSSADGADGADGEDGADGIGSSGGDGGEGGDAEDGGSGGGGGDGGNGEDGGGAGTIDIPSLFGP